MINSAPAAALLPARCPIAPGLGLFNWPPVVLPSGPIIELSGPTPPTSPTDTSDTTLRSATSVVSAPITCPRDLDADLLHEAIFHQPHVVGDIGYLAVVEKLDRAPAATPGGAPVRFVDGSAQLVTDRPIRIGADPAIDPPAPGDVALFAYDNSRIALLDKPTRNQFSLSTARLMDSALLFLRGECDEATFARASQTFVNTIRAAAGYEARAEWPLPRNQRHFPPSQQARAQAVERDQATKGQRLGALLKAWMNIDCSPTGDTYQHGQYRYILRPWVGVNCDGLFVEVEAPDGRSWIRSKIAFSPNDLQTRLREINEEYERRVTTDDVDTLENRISHRRATLNHEAIKTVRKNLFGEIHAEKASGSNV